MRKITLDDKNLAVKYWLVIDFKNRVSIEVDVNFGGICAGGECVLSDKYNEAEDSEMYEGNARFRLEVSNLRDPVALAAERALNNLNNIIEANINRAEQIKRMINDA